MKIVLDRSVCQCWIAPCESHFGWHFLGEEIRPVDCTVKIEEDGKEELTFLIKDRDGTDKVLVVDEHNQAEAYDSWLLAWHNQQANNNYIRVGMSDTRTPHQPGKEALFLPEKPSSLNLTSRRYQKPWRILVYSSYWASPRRSSDLRCQG